VVLNLAMFIVEIFFMPEELLYSLVMQPEHLWNLNLLPMAASWFLHASVAHLLGNLLFLFLFGRIVERHFGTARFLLIYFGSAIVSDVISSLAGQGGIGASGAIAGLISAAILIEPFYITFIVGIPLPIILVGWLAIFADVMGILNPVPGDNVGHFAHLGGYIAISILIFLFNAEERGKMLKGLITNMIFVLSYVLLSVFWQDITALVSGLF
jgi:membrane associated rhomboid family serine protease